MKPDQIDLYWFLWVKTNNWTDTLEAETTKNQPVKVSFLKQWYTPDILRAILVHEQLNMHSSPL